MISGKARLAGVIGWPVAHSRSPLLHNFWLARYGVDGAYLPLAVRPQDFARVVGALRDAGFAGANVTIPHKQAAFDVCDRVDESARRAGAVNTLVFTADGIHGSNTDGVGFLANLRAHGVSQPGSALLLGAGGAARAIAAALLETGAAVRVANRSAERTQALALALPGIEIVPWEQREAVLGACDLLVNTTSLGMEGQPALAIDLARAQSGLVVADIVYVPSETDLLVRARARGLRVVAGLGMLLHQAVPGFAAWFGVTPVVDEAAFALLEADIAQA